MMKNILFNIISLSLIFCLAGCNKEATVNPGADDISNNVITTVPSAVPTKIPRTIVPTIVSTKIPLSIVPTIVPTKISLTIVPTIVPENSPSISEILCLASEWKPNHGNVNITYEKVDDYGDYNEYVFISPTDGWKAYIGPIGAGQRFIVLYKTNDGGRHWDKIYEPPMGGGDIVFLNSKVGWMIHNYPINGEVELSKTLDGGITWEDERIKTPIDYSNIVFSTGLPVFFSQKDGIMLASGDDISNDIDDEDSIAFITHDGGETWSLNAKDDIDEIFTWDLTWKNVIISDLEITYYNEEWHSINNIEWVKVSNE